MLIAEVYILLRLNCFKLFMLNHNLCIKMLDFAKFSPVLKYKGSYWTNTFTDQKSITVHNFHVIASECLVLDILQITYTMCPSGATMSYSMIERDPHSQNQNKVLGMSPYPLKIVARICHNLKQLLVTKKSK